jgi:hypothetical protein
MITLSIFILNCSSKMKNTLVAIFDNICECWYELMSSAVILALRMAVQYTRADEKH